jgi:phage-related protein
MAEDDTVEIVIRLKDLQSFVAGTEEAAVSIRKIGTASKETAQIATTSLERIPGVVGRIKEAAHSTVAALSGMKSKVSSSLSGMEKSMSSIGKKSLIPGGPVGQIAAMALGGLSIAGVKDAVTSTVELARNAESLHKVTGMSTQDAATWQAVTNAYGVNARAFGLTMKTVATQAQSALGGGKGGAKAVAEFKSMGISMNDLKGHSKDMNAELGLVMDGFNKMPPGVSKTALATKLFGRNWQAMMPIISQGSKALADQRKEAAAYGVTLNSNATKNAMKLHEAQVKLSLATQGLKVQFAENLAPILFKVFDLVMKLYAVIAKNMNPAFKTLGSIIDAVTKYFKEHHTQLMIVRDAVILLGIAWLAFKIQILAARVATLLLRGALMLLDMNPWVLAIMAVIIVVILLIKHWKSIKPIIMDVVNWVTNAWKNIKNAVSVAITDIINFVKQWWPLILGIMLGPIGLIIGAIVKFHDQIINFISDMINTVVNFVKSHWVLLITLFGGPIGLIVGIFIKFHDQVISLVTDVWNFIKSIPGKIEDIFTSAASTIISAITSPFKAAFDWISKISVHITTTHIGPISVPSGISVTTGQHGGVMMRSGLALVGEAGPEIVHLPGGSRIQPHSSTSVGSVRPGDKAPSPFIISVQIQRQEIARAVGKFTSDKQARQ